MVTEDRQGRFREDTDDIRRLSVGGDVIGTQRHLEQPREDWGKGIMTVLEDSSGNLIRTACTALVSSLKCRHTASFSVKTSTLSPPAHLHHSGEVGGVGKGVGTAEVIGQLP